MILQNLYTPLHYGAVYGHSEVISVLLTANADVNRTSKVSCMICITSLNTIYCGGEPEQY